VSRSHAELIRVGANYLLRDLGSDQRQFRQRGSRHRAKCSTTATLCGFGSGGPEMIFRLIEADSGEASPLPRHEERTTDN